nr:pentapeptide repeat-containing protein [Herpetosiphonaceae bacterium]
NLSGASLSRANLDGASLYGASLDGASLYGVNLSRANLLNAAGIYTAFTPFLSSRRAALLGGIVLVEGQIELRFWAGCKQSKTASELLKYVKKTHGGDIHAKQYKAVVTFMKACFKADMAEGRWDYLLTWKTPEAQKGEHS